MNIASRGMLNDSRFPKKERAPVAVYVNSLYFIAL